MLSAPTNPLEVRYHDPSVGSDALHPTSPVPVPYPYGGEGYVTELMDSGGGLMTTATTMALFARQRAAWGLGGRMPSARTGGMAGVSSLAESKADDVDFAFVFNTRRFAQPGDPLGDFTAKLESMLAAAKLPTPSLHLQFA